MISSISPDMHFLHLRRLLWMHSKHWVQGFCLNFFSSQDSITILYFFYLQKQYPNQIIPHFQAWLNLKGAISIDRSFWRGLSAEDSITCQPSQMLEGISIEFKVYYVSLISLTYLASTCVILCSLEDANDWAIIGIISTGWASLSTLLSRSLFVLSPLSDLEQQAK